MVAFYADMARGFLANPPVWKARVAEADQAQHGVGTGGAHAVLPFPRRVIQ